MKKFIKLNSDNAHVRRPIRVSDLQDIWDGMERMLAGDNLTRILCGCAVVDTWVMEGVIAHGGQLYNFEGASLNSQLYANVYDNAWRTFEDGASRPFSQYKVINTVPSSEYVGQLTLTEINLWRLVRTGNINNQAVTSEKIANHGVKTPNIDIAAVTEEKIANGAVTENKIAPNSIVNTQIKNKTIDDAKFVKSLPRVVSIALINKSGEVVYKVGEHFTLSKTGVGSYRFTDIYTFSIPMVCPAIASGGGSLEHIVYVTNVGTGWIDVSVVKRSDGTAVDGAFVIYLTREGLT